MEDGSHQMSDDQDGVATARHDTSASSGSGARADSTWSLRQKLGFHDDAVWKQLSTRRLEFIHSLGLNLKKASEQEKEITAVAGQLCAEYGYSSVSLGDFEKLVRAGVQSVRRNQRRPAKSRQIETHQVIMADDRLNLNPADSQAHQPVASIPSYMNGHFVGPGPALPPAFGTAQVPHAMSPGPRDLHSGPSSANGSTGSPSASGSPTQGPVPVASAAALPGVLPRSASAFSLSRGSQMTPPLAVPPRSNAQSATTLDPQAMQRVDHALTEFTVAARAVLPFTNSVDPAVARLTSCGAIRLAIGMAVASQAQPKPCDPSIIFSLEQGTLGEALAEIVDPHGAKDQRAFARIVAALVMQRGTSATDELQLLIAQLLSVPEVAVPQILEVLQQARGPLNVESLIPTPRMTPNLLPLSASTSGLDFMSALEPTGAAPPLHAEQANSPAGVWDVRHVTLRYGSASHEFTYSPLRNTPPSIGELVENGRQMFHLPQDTIVRLRNAARNTFIDNNTDLAEAFLQTRIDIELLMPPPPLLQRQPPGPARFATVNPIIRR